MYVPAPFRYEKVRDELAKKKKCAFVTFDSFIHQLVVPISEMKLDRIVFCKEVRDGDKTKLHFIGDNALRGEYDVIESLWKWCVSLDAKVPSLNDQARLVIPFEDYAAAKTFIDDHTNTRFTLFVTGMIVPYVQYDKVERAYKEKYVVVANEYFVKEDKFDDVALMMPHIKTWKDIIWWRDYKTFEPFYPEIVSVLLWHSVMYMEFDRAAFNLILTGKNGCGKTSCIAAALRVFAGEDSILSGTTGTDKGLVPSFYGDKPHDGYLITKGFLKGMDEFFRAPVRSNDIGLNKKSLLIKTFLEKIMELITRKKYRVGQGKTENYIVQMSASFAAADNLDADTRQALSLACREDPAILRRFTFLQLYDSDWENMKRANKPPHTEAYHEVLAQKFPNLVGISYYGLSRLSVWCRDQIQNIEVDSSRCLDLYIDLFIAELRLKLNDRGVLGVAEDEMRTLVSRIDYSDHMVALVKCSAIMRSIYEQKTAALPTIKVKEEDYIYAGKLFQRIAQDSIFLFIDDFQSMVGGGGIQRI